jgi:hypothetical protein
MHSTLACSFPPVKAQMRPHLLTSGPKHELETKLNGVALQCLSKACLLSLHEGLRTHQHTHGDLARISGLVFLRCRMELMRGGRAQCAGHAIRAGTPERSEDVTIQIHCTDAFLALSRTSMQRPVAELAPQVLRFALCMYKHSRQLWLPVAPPGWGPLLSRSRVRQADPCRPLFFALATQRVREVVQC